MQLIDMLKNSGAVHSMAQKVGIDDDQATAGAAALMPALLSGLEKQSRANSEGLSGVASMLGGLGGGDMLDQVLSSNSPDVNAGNGVLGQLFGSKDVSRAVAQNASSSTGLDPALLKKMLPLLAMVVGGYVAKQAQARNAQGTGADTQTTQSAGGGLGGMLGSLFGGDQDRGGKGGLESLLGFGGNSNALDDVLKGLGGGGKPH